MHVRRDVVESMWEFLKPNRERTPWEKLALIMSEFKLTTDKIPNRWELAMAIKPEYIVIVNTRIFEPLVIAVNNLDGALHHIRSHCEPITKDSSTVAIVIGTAKKRNEQICNINTDIWEEIKIRTHSIVKTKKDPKAKEKIKKFKKKGGQTVL